jgi:hypothetical protein
MHCSKYIARYEQFHNVSRYFYILGEEASSGGENTRDYFRNEPITVVARPKA